MPSLRPRLASLVLLAATTVFAPGCIKQMLLDGQIEGTREGAKQMDTTADFEVARIAASAGIAQFEGMHRLAPDNTDAYYLLVKSYASYAFAFVEDDMELAYLRGDDEQGDYHKARASSLYTRAIGYGTEWMEKKHAGFAAATKSGRDEDIVRYLAKFDDKSDADLLFWTGQAWMSRVNATKDIGLIGTLYVGKRMIERVLALDPAYESGTPHVLLGAASSSTGVATLGPDSFKAAADHFAQAEQLSGGHDLLVKVQRATNFACHMDDAAPGRRGSFELYNKLLGEVLAVDDPTEGHRLVNAIAKRRARRYASQKWVETQMADECGWDLDEIQKAMPAPK